MSYSPYMRLVHDYPAVPFDFTISGQYAKDHVMHYFKSGAGVYRSLEGETPIGPGLVAVHGPGEPWSFRLSPACPGHMLNIIYDPVERADSYYAFPYPQDLVRADLETLDAIDPSAPPLPRTQFMLVPAEFEGLFHQLDAAMRQETAYARILRKALFLEILALLYRNAVEDAGSANRSPRREYERLVTEAIAAMRDSIGSSTPLTLHELATRLAVSRSLLSRVFCQRMGVPPMRYLQRMKIEQAQVELLLHMRSIGETAELLGFSSVHHFSRVFAEQTGQPPGRFVRGIRGAGERGTK